MTGISIHEINIIISIVAASSSLFIAFHAWQRRHAHGAYWFITLVGAIAWVSFWYSLEAAVEYDINAYVTFSKIEYIGLTFIPLFWLGFALTFSSEERSLSRRMIWLLSIIPALTIILAFTNEWHGLIWQQPEFDTGRYGPIFAPIYGGGFWVFIAYTYVIFLIGSFILIRYTMRTWHTYRVQAIVVFIATLLPWVSNMLQIFDNLNPLPELYLNSIFLTVMMILFALGLFRWHLLDIIPLAYETMLNNVPLGIVVTDMSERIVAINQSVKRYMDNSVANPIGRRMGEVFAPYTSYIASPRLQSEMKDEWRVGDRVFEVQLAPMTDERGVQRGHVYVLRDMTAERKAQEDLKYSQQLFDIAFSQALDGFFFMMLDEPMRWDDTVDKEAALDYAMQHQRMTRVNNAMLEQYGATREQIIGRTLAEFFAHDIQAGRDAVRQGYDNGRMRIETEERTLDGRPIWIEGDYICLYDAEGRITGNFAVQRDVTARKEAEARLLESEYRYRMLFEANADAIFLMTTDGDIMAANPSSVAWFGYSFDELISMNRKQLIAPDEFQNTLDILDLMLAGEQIPIYERHLIRKNGERVLAEVNVALIRDSNNGQPLYIQSILHDITERKKAEQQSLALAFEKGRVQLLANFIRDVSHEFRTPLAIIQSSLYIMQKTDNPEKHLEKIPIMSEQVTRVTQLVDRLVMMTQLDSGMLFSFHRENINSLVQQVTDTMRTAFAEKNLTLRLELDESLPLVTVDTIHLVEALSQLIDNAVRYTLRDGSITIQTGCQAEWLTIAITDTGVGIADEVMPRIFERFYRHDEAHSTPGFGLGLPIAQKIVELHEGRIEAESEIGKGSRFVVYLPITTQPHES